MNGRQRVREAIIAMKMTRWSLIARHPAVYRHYSSARARRNYWRLLSRYPEIARRLGLTVKGGVKVSQRGGVKVDQSSW
jgi:hypothetical protein